MFIASARKGSWNSCWHHSYFDHNFVQLWLFLLILPHHGISLFILILELSPSWPPYILVICMRWDPKTATIYSLRVDAKATLYFVPIFMLYWTLWTVELCGFFLMVWWAVWWYGACVAPLTNWTREEDMRTYLINVRSAKQHLQRRTHRSLFSTYAHGASASYFSQNQIEV